MDLFEEIRKREEDKRKRQEEKVQKLRQKLNKVDTQFFEDDADNGDLLKRRELLTFQPKELQTVFVEDSNSSEPQQQTGCLTLTLRQSFETKKQSFFLFFLCPSCS